MPKTDNTHLVHYTVRADLATPERFLEFCDQVMPLMAPVNAAHVAITLERVTLQGSTAEVRTLLNSVSTIATPISATAQFQMLSPAPPVATHGPPQPARPAANQNVFTFSLTFATSIIQLIRQGNVALPANDEKLIQAVRTMFTAALRHHDSESIAGSLAHLELKLVAFEQGIGRIGEQLESVRIATEEIEKTKVTLKQQRHNAESAVRAIEEARTTADDIRARVTAAHDEATRRKIEVVEMAGKVAALNTEVSSVHASVVTAAKNSVPELEAQIKNTLEQAKKLVEKTEVNTNESLKSLRESVASESDKVQREINQVSTDNVNNRKMINDLLGDATVANLFGAFKQRANTLEGNLKWWLLATVITAGALVYWAHRVISEIINIPDVTTIHILRAAATLPLIGLFWFFIHNYQRTAHLGEHYAFKAAIAASFVHYQQLIESPKVGDSKNGGAFILETVKGLFTPPGIHTELERNEMKRLLQLLEKLGVTAITEGAGVAKKVLEQKNKVSVTAKQANQSNGTTYDSQE